MEMPLEISFRDMEPSSAVEEKIRERVGRLEKIFSRATSCHVYLLTTHKNQNRGIHYEIHIELRIPGTELVVNSDPGDVNTHTDIYVAIRDAFDAMERQLKKRKQQMKGHVKQHVMPLQGRVAELQPGQDFGQIAASDGRLIYFHRNSVIGNQFDKLSTGDAVELVVREKESPKGPQASTVRPIGEMEFVGSRN